MINNVFIKNYKAIPVNKKEILRYLKAKKEEGFEELLNECIKEAESALKYRVCYIETDVKKEKNICDFDVLNFSSKDLAKCLENSKKAIIFAATIGVEIDRLILKNMSISPTKAVIFDAIGSERIEALCDTFCNEIKAEKNAETTPRFSAGYGDLALQNQEDIFNILNCSKNIGLTLNDSLIMSPNKSVTAIFGIEEGIL